MTDAATLTAALTDQGAPSPARLASLLLRGSLAAHVTAEPLPAWVSLALATCDPEAAVVGVERLAETPAAALVLALIHEGNAEAITRLLQLMAASSAAVDVMVRCPHLVGDVIQIHRAPQTRGLPLIPDTGGEHFAEMARWERPPDPSSAKATVEVFHRDGLAAARASLRQRYRVALLRSVAVDVSSAVPLAIMPTIGERLADAAADTLHAAYELACAQHPDEASRASVAIIGMGKCGARELNYISDVDVIFCTAPRGETGQTDALAAATVLATETIKACSAAGAEPPLWQVDTALRPEGAQGPLVRTVESHVAYYTTWAKTWEFQALLKARPLAGDWELGQRYLQAVSPLIWQATGREGSVEEIQAMRRRVEEHIPLPQRERQLKLAPGGLRDIEFAVQLLQLVHGRTDASLRVRSTVDALAALSAGGYISRDDAVELDESYRFLRCLEHRIQLHRMKRTHLMPTAAGDLRRIGQLMGVEAPHAEQLVAARGMHATRVRRIHERLFYRPLLSAVARLSPGERSLDPGAAQERLAALGFSDAAGALRHLHSLTEGVSRAAAIQRTLLPVMVGWLADEARPDAGLLAFRRLSEAHGRTHWYLKMLRDEGHAAEQLTRVLARSRYAADILVDSPHAVSVLGDPRGSALPDAATASTLFTTTAGRREDTDEAMTALAAARRLEIVRILVADLTSSVSTSVVARSLTAVADAALTSALDLAVRWREQQTGHSPQCGVALIGMGRYGGAELGYGSDLDAMLAYDVLPGGDVEQAAEDSLAIAHRLVALASPRIVQPALGLDLDVRPEGKSGPIIRSAASYEAYYQRWSEPWERQALLRARVVAGDPAVCERILGIIDQVRWTSQGLSTAQLRTMRVLKARMETERLPRGANPKYHLKLGPGGLSDVEWVVQLLQLRHGHALATLRTTDTALALEAAVAEGLLSHDDGAVLGAAWEWCSSVRNAIVAWKGRAHDLIPSSALDAEGVWRLVGGEPGQGHQLEETHLQLTRRARKVTEREFYGESREHGA